MASSPGRICCLLSHLQYCAWILYCVDSSLFNAMARLLTILYSDESCDNFCIIPICKLESLVRKQMLVG